MTVALFLRDAGPITPEYVNHGLEKACANRVIATGVNCYLGKLTNKNVADAHGYNYTDLMELI